jgi:MFS transporter, DHA3 family, multidrug efflux protein
VKTFYKLLANTLIASATNNFLWFALVFWAYLETGSILVTSIVGGSYMLLSALVGMVFGTFVDHHRKKTVMLYSSVFTLIMFSLAMLMYILWPQEDLLRITGPHFWGFISLILVGAVAGNARMIAISTTVTMLVPEKSHDRANGLVGTVNGLAFSLTSVFSGLAIGQLGMGWTLIFAVGFTVLAIAHLLPIKVKEKQPESTEDAPKRMDIKGTIAAIHVVPGLMALLFFATFNNFLGGVFMALMDPYGLNLVSVEVWGFIWGFLSIGFIVGGIIVARKGLGKNPLRTLLLANVGMWILCILFPIRSAIVPLIISMFIYMCLIPVVEASEQTIIQKVVPFKRQGRVFGFGQTIEMLASPVSSFLIGPIAQLWVIPFMTNGAGARNIGSWFGTGTTRGMALIFISAGTIGLIITILALRSRAYSVLSGYYRKSKVKPDIASASSLT